MPRRPALAALLLAVVSAACTPPSSAARARPAPATARVPAPEPLAVSEQRVPEEPATSPVPSRSLTPAQAREAMAPRPPAPFLPSTSEDNQVLGSILATLFEAARREADDGELAPLVEQAREIGFELEAWRVDERRYWALIELPAQRRGAGSYVIRVGVLPPGQPEIVLQAPHVFFDRGTGVIAAALFFGPAGGGRARALYTNTAHRYGGPESSAKDRDDSPSDLCHIADHAFHSATEAAARVLAPVQIIQLHGFADSPERPALIVSSGRAEAATPLAHDLARELGALFDQVARFPDDVSELGGTTNAQGHVLAVHLRAEFVHLELSAETRASLQGSEELMSGFGDALLRARAVPSGPDEEAPEEDEPAPTSDPAKP